jgi:hypothetical protein
VGEAVTPFGAARSVLAVGIGGGGDVVGAMATVTAARALGLAAHVGGVTWERRPIDPLPGPRRIDEVRGAEPFVDGAVLATPDTTGPGGFHFAESRMAEFLGEPVLLVDPTPGPAAVAAALDAAAERLGCDLVALVDVGGDVLAHGDEPGLASPLCDSIMLAAAAHLRTPSIGAVFGLGCDGELTHDEVMARLAEVAAAGGWRGAWGLTPGDVDLLTRAVAVVPTEASASALRCARGEIGTIAIREGRRTVPLSPAGALTFYFDPAAALASAARLGAAVVDCGSLLEAEAVLAGRGIRTEYAYERDFRDAATAAEPAHRPPA